MTEEQFQKEYHDYHTHIEQDAREEAEKVNLETDGFTVVAVELPPLGWSLMLETARDALTGMGLGI